MSNTGSRTFQNIVISWTASTSGSKVDVEISSGGAAVAMLTFTPDTLNQNLNYNNPPQFAKGHFMATFGPEGKDGQLSCENFSWNINNQDGGPVTAFIGSWSLS